MIKDKAILVVDDEKNIRNSIKLVLEAEGAHTSLFSHPLKAISHTEENPFDLGIFDIDLPELTGLEMFQKIRSNGHDFPVIFISGNASLDQAANAVKQGGADFIEKPFNAEKLIVSVERCLELHQLKYRLLQLEKNLSNDKIIGESNEIKKVKNAAIKVAKSEANVLISGETGTGKELVAQLIHENSTRAKSKFIKLNCSAIPDNLIESELFGHEKGAFTGALNRHRGLFEQAHGGTLFLDEIGDMSLQAQAKALRATQNKEIQPLGSERLIKVDARIITASHKNLQSEVDAGNFREDLFYRLSVVPIVIPPLRDRLKDISLLAIHFMEIFCKKNAFPTKKIQPEVLQALKKYHWPGNIRELQNLVERMVIMGGDMLTLDDLPSTILENTGKMLSSSMTLEEFKKKSEKSFILQTLKNCKGNISKAANKLGIERTYLHRKISQHKIKKKDYI